MERLDQFDQCGTDPDQVKDVLVAVQQAQAEQLATVQEKVWHPFWGGGVPVMAAVLVLMAAMTTFMEAIVPFSPRALTCAAHTYLPAAAPHSCRGSVSVAAGGARASGAQTRGMVLPAVLVWGYQEILATLYECYEPSWVESGIDDGE
eukprot:922167-Rhodomonas_salina.1